MTHDQANLRTGKTTHRNGTEYLRAGGTISIESLLAAEAAADAIRFPDETTRAHGMGHVYDSTICTDDDGCESATTVAWRGGEIR